MKRVLIVLAGLFLLSGQNCIDFIGGTGSEQRNAALWRFNSADDLRKYFVDQATARTATTSRGSLFDFLALPAPTGSTATDAGTAAPESGGAGGSFTQTNIQEIGVDEGDVVKSGDGHFYIVKGDTVRVVRADPASDLQQVGTIDLPSSPDSLYLYGKKLVAISQSYGWYDDIMIMKAVAADSIAPWPGGSNTQQTTVTVLDVTNPAAPASVATLKFDGTIASSRMVGSKLHLIMTTRPPLPDNPIPLALATRSLEEWIPDYQIEGSDGSSSGGDVVSWEDFYHPANADGYGVTLVITVDIDNPTDKFESTAIVADAGTVYASTEALYVTDTSYDIYGTWREDTAVHKFDLTGGAGASYVGSGLVPGHLLNQYSLGESNGYLRVATTVGSMGGFGVNRETVSNAVYVLGENAEANALQITGRIEEIARGETLYSARFIGDRGFLVTFKKVDPLFTLDLKDPANPKLVGQLKVPGYSDYIHLMDENHLLTIGKDASDAGEFAWYQGVQLSIFDVTDFANPTLLDKEIIGVRGTESEANHNPKAFTYYAAKNALAFPVDLYDGPTSSADDYGRYTFSGLYVYRVTVANGFEYLGRIATRPPPGENDWSYWYYGSYTRGIFAENSDVVYAVTDSVVKSAPLATPSTSLDDLTLPE